MVDALSETVINSAEQITSAGAAGDLRQTEAEEIAERRKRAPPLASILCLDDFERVAERVLGSDSQTFSYYRSAADDERTFDVNRQAWSMLGFRPRVLVDVDTISLNTSFLGQPVNFPVFIAPTAFASLGHSEGELCNVTGAAEHSGTYCMSRSVPVLATDAASHV